jgi:hypothetical protein
MSTTQAQSYRPKPVVQVVKPPMKQTLLDSFFIDTVKIKAQKDIKRTIEKATKKHFEKKENESPT